MFKFLKSLKVSTETSPSPKNPREGDTRTKRGQKEVYNKAEGGWVAVQDRDSGNKYREKRGQRSSPFGQNKFKKGRR